MQRNHKTRLPVCSTSITTLLEPIVGYSESLYLLLLVLPCFDASLTDIARSLTFICPKQFVVATSKASVANANGSCKSSLSRTTWM